MIINVADAPLTTPANFTFSPIEGKTFSGLVTTFQYGITNVGPGTVLPANKLFAFEGYAWAGENAVALRTHLAGLPGG